MSRELPIDLLGAAMAATHRASVSCWRQGDPRTFRSDNGRTALAYAAFSGSIETARTLVEAGAEIDLADHQGWTPLMVAISQGHASVADGLLQLGASTASRTQSGQTPLMLRRGWATSRSPVASWPRAPTPPIATAAASPC